MCNAMRSLLLLLAAFSDSSTPARGAVQQQQQQQQDEEGGMMGCERMQQRLNQSRRLQRHLERSHHRYRGDQSPHIWGDPNTTTYMGD